MESRAQEAAGHWVLPSGGQWAPTKSTLDPAIFSDDHSVHPWVRAPLLAMLGAFWAPRYSAWQSWAKVYLAGSMVSYWWGTPDCDVLIGVDAARFRRANPALDAPSTEAEVAKMLTEELRTGLDPYTAAFRFPPSPDYLRVLEALGAEAAPIEVPGDAVIVGNGEAVEVTWYVNRASYDIRAIRPYAAYDLSADRWAVRPVQVGRHWGPEAVSPSFWAHMRTLADSIHAAVSLPPGPERDAHVAAAYEGIHAQRSAAYGPGGRGLFDPGSLQWVTLGRWGLLGALEAALGRPVTHPAPTLP